MKKIYTFSIISAIFVCLLILSACQDEKQAQQPASNSEGIDGAAAAKQPAAKTITPKNCSDKCNVIGAWCEIDSLYACTQEGDCKVKNKIEECGSECIDINFCLADGKKRGILTLGPLMAANPSIKGDVGEGFDLNVANSGEKLKCSIEKVVKGQAIILCGEE
jgi:hypothetical protein